VTAILSRKDAAGTFRHLEDAGVDAGFKTKSLAVYVAAQELSKL